MTMYIYVEYKSTLSDSVLVLMHKSVANASCIHRQWWSEIMTLPWWRHLTVSEIVSCVGWKTMQVQPGKIDDYTTASKIEYLFTNFK